MYNNAVVCGGFFKESDWKWLLVFGKYSLNLGSCSLPSLFTPLPSLLQDVFFHSLAKMVKLDVNYLCQGGGVVFHIGRCKNHPLQNVRKLLGFYSEVVNSSLFPPSPCPIKNLCSVLFLIVFIYFLFGDNTCTPSPCFSVYPNLDIL